MRRRIRLWALAGLILLLGPPVARGQSRVVVTLLDLIQGDHAIEIVTGTEVVWADRDFVRVWFSPGAGAPPVERTEGGLRAVFDKPGTYPGLFMIAGWHHGQVDRMRIMVKEGTP
jgi:hypothetical protein